MKVFNTVTYVGFTALALAMCLLPVASVSGSLLFTPELQADGSANDEAFREREELKIAALQGLLSAPTERSLPLVQKVLSGSSSVGVKRKALFVLGQTEHRDAQELLLNYASRPGSLQVEAIRMIGVGGVTESLSRLRQIYSSSDKRVREAVLRAYLIADDSESVYQIAQASNSDEEFDQAVQILGAMNARDKLRSLYDSASGRESLVQAYAVAGDLESLIRLARESTSEEQRTVAIRNIGIVGTQKAKQELENLYRAANSDQLRDAALQGMIISEHDRGVLNLFRESQNIKQKRDLMRTLVIMDSDLAIDVIDSALLGE